MSGLQCRKSKDLQKTSAGCVGMMVNMYDFNASVARTKRLTDTAHRDESPTRLSRPDAKKTNDLSAAQKDNKRINSHSNNNISVKRSGGTPVKMLMAQEMSKEAEPKQKGPSVVARLMGLDDYLPAQQPIMSTSRRNPIGGYPKNSVGTLGGSRQQNSGFSNKVVPCDFHQGHKKKMEFKDVYETWQQPSGAFSKDPHVTIGNTQNENERRMALVREKFIEAKRLATDQKLLQSKEFQDALEVLSSNRDLFLKYLEEPNSLFSKQIKDLNANRMSSQTRRITVLKPSKIAELDIERPIIKQSQIEDKSGWDINTHSRSSNFEHLKAENFLHPTRIVVLKPCTTKVYSMEAPIIDYSELSKQNKFDEDFGDIIKLESRYMSKPFTRHMQESSAYHRRDESLLSSIYSNDYGEDSSSFCRSEKEFTEEDGGSYSDSEFVTPTSRHSWDSLNKYYSTFSASSFSRNSLSPESSVTREAKKRLSERWALMAASGINHELDHLQKSSSTLGEMLAVPEVKKEENNDNPIHAISKSCGGENELIPASCLSISRAKDGGGENSPRSLSRSKSVPISSTTYEKLDLNPEGSNTQVSKTTASNDAPKTKKGKLSLKGKFSSFFFSRSKKPNRENPASPAMLSSDCDIQYNGMVPTTGSNDGIPKPAVEINVPLEINCKEESETAVKEVTDIGVLETASFFQKAALTIDETRESSDFSNKETQGSYGNLNNKLNQTSPTSVLDAPLEYDGNEYAVHSSEADSGQHSTLSRASPIASVARTLSWEDDHLNVPSSKQLKSCKASSKANYSIQEQFAWVEKLLSSADLYNSGMIFARWHSLDSPLDPALLENLMDLKDDSENCREKRSSQRLLFDCVNLAILEVSHNLYYSCPRKCTSFKTEEEPQADNPELQEVQSLLNDWFSVKDMQVSSEASYVSVVVEKALRQEVGGQWWTVSMRLELEEISKELSGEVLKYLVDETLADVAATWC